MSALFVNTIKQALITFDRANIASFKANFNILKQSTEKLTFRDLNLDPELLAEATFKKPGKAPCTYIHIFQNSDVAMSVFILRDNYSMPLHDHPMMHGILKVLSGNLQIKSYTKKSSDEKLIYDKTQCEIPVREEPEKLINANTGCAILTPTDSNFHEIRTVGEITAFFDILSPPYETDIPIYGIRSCNYYQKYATVDSTGKQELILMRTIAPASYYCDTEHYEKPEFLREYIDTYHDSDSSSS